MHVRHVFFCLVLCLCAHPAWSLSWGGCIYTTKEETFTPPSGVQLSIDPDLAVGTVLYSTFYLLAESAGLTCHGHPTTYSGRVGLIFGSGGGATESMTGYGVSNGPYTVFKTNVEGIGVVFREKEGSNALPYFSTATNYSDRAIVLVIGAGRGIWMDLIKYGPITPGANSVSITSTSVPKIELAYNVSLSTNASGVPNGNVPLLRVTIAPATFSVLNATCNTPDVAVDLGKRKIFDAANQSGGKFVTPWMDASIHLTNCPTFYGIGGRSYESTKRDNIMTVTLIPNNATTSNQGIMPVDNVAGAAAGVGIQMAWGTSASPQLVNFSVGGEETKKYTMSSSQGANYTIPLVARYMQTAASISGVTAGKANGKVTYLMSYH